jgi:hypothetical protein
VNGGRIETLIYTNENGESLAFSHTSAFCTQEATGLTDVRSTLYTIHSMGQDGDSYVASRIEGREIDISGSIRERDPVKARELRRKLARVLNPKLDGVLSYQYGDFLRVIGCRAVSSPVVTKKPQDIYHKFSLTLTCLKPFWREASERRTDVAAWVGALEFPVRLPAAGMSVGYRQPSVIVNVYNGGDVESGIRAEMSAVDTVVNPKILNVATGEFIRFVITLSAGDTLAVSTGYADKWATYTHEGAEDDALKYLDIDSTFLTLEPGDNLIKYEADSGVDNLEIVVYHSNRYLGV